MRSGARGEYGELVPIRPAAGVPVQCLRGEYLSHYGMTATYRHRYRLHGTLCETCRTIEARDPGERRLAEWARIDVTDQRFPAAAPQQGLVLVAHPPVTGALTGRIELVLDGTAVGTVTLTCCPACRTATLDYVHVVTGHRRLGCGRTLVAAAHACTPDYRWSAPLPPAVPGRHSVPVSRTHQRRRSVCITSPATERRDSTPRPDGPSLSHPPGGPRHRVPHPARARVTSPTQQLLIKVQPRITSISAMQTASRASPAETPPASQEG